MLVVIIIWKCRKWKERKKRNLFGKSNIFFSIYILCWIRFIFYFLYLLCTNRMRWNTRSDVSILYLSLSMDVLWQDPYPNINKFNKDKYFINLSYFIFFTSLRISSYLHHIPFTFFFRLNMLRYDFLHMYIQSGMNWCQYVM